MLLPTLALAATLTFPIPQLGNCQSIAECKAYCDIPWHQSVCKNYAQKLEKKENVLAAVKINYPIPELGNCKSKEDCKAYCDMPINYEDCGQFAERHGLKPTRPGQEKLNQLTFPIPELGNCASREECKEYCDNPANREACQSFAEEQGLVEPKEPPAELEFPIAELGNCASVEECDAFCRRPENKDKCLEYAKATDMEEYFEDEFGEGKEEGMPEISFPIAELGNCGSVEECDAYCSRPENKDKCLEYARATGMQEYFEDDFGEGEEEGMPEITFPIAELGNCGSMEECAIYCQQPDHRETCTAFAEAQGLKPPRKMEGPGGCSSKEECEAYCNNPANRKECQEFAQKVCAENPDLEKCQQGPPGTGPGGCSSPEECKEYCKNNPGDPSCQQAKERFCAEHPEKCKEKEEEMKKDKDMEYEFKEDFTGPGGCTTPEECKKYCENNPDDSECKEMKPKLEDLEKKEKIGPGGCTSPEECIEYCKNNTDDPFCSEEMMEKVRDYEEDLKR